MQGRRHIAVAVAVAATLALGANGCVLVRMVRPLKPDPPGVDLENLPGPWTNHRAKLVDRRLHVHYLEAGDTVPADAPDSELVILLHGFPDLPYGWRYVIPELADRHVFAPTLRGYGATDHPKDGYDLVSLARDLDSFIHYANVTSGRDARAPVHVIAHDWGASIAWELAIRDPARFATLTVLDIPHPVAFADLVSRSDEQAKYKWFVIQLVSPVAPRVLAGMTSEERGDVMFREELVDDTRLQPADLAIYDAAFNTPEEMRGPLAYYHRLVDDSDAIAARAQAAGKVAVPMLILWGAEDHYMLPELAPLSCAQVEHCAYEVFPGAGHFLPWERPREVSQRWRQFVQAQKPAPSTLAP